MRAVVKAFALACACGLLVAGSATAAQTARTSLVDLATISSWPASDGHRILWSGGPGVVRTLDPRTGSRRSFAVRPACQLRDATTDLALIACPAPENSAGQAYVLHTETGQEFELPGVSLPLRIGAQWVRYAGTSDCEKCGATGYRNWRTGETHVVDFMADELMDLDSPDFRPVPVPDPQRYALGQASTAGARSLAATLDLQARREPEYRVSLVTSGGVRILDRCVEDCLAPLLTSTRAAWINNSNRSYTVRTMDLRTGRRLSWSVPRPHSTVARLLSVGGTTVLARATDTGVRLQRLRSTR